MLDSANCGSACSVAGIPPHHTNSFADFKAPVTETLPIDIDNLSDRSQESSSAGAVDSLPTNNLNITALKSATALIDRLSALARKPTFDSEAKLQQEAVQLSRKIGIQPQQPADAAFELALYVSIMCP